MSQLATEDPRMTIIKYETPKDELHKFGSHTTGRLLIFLAGPTVRGNQPHLTSWRRQAEEEFSNQGFDGNLIVPEFTDPRESDQYRYDIPEWEFEGLTLADAILFWVCRTRELIGLTTNYEFGYWTARQRSKVVYGRPNDAYRVKYTDIMWKLDATENGEITALPPPPVYETLPDVVTAAINLAKERARQ